MAADPNKIIILLRALRVYQWTKNGLVIVPLVFAEALTNLHLLLVSLLAFTAFCFAASATYLFNDLRDVEQDRAHPEKCGRPIASGALSASCAWAMMLCLLAAALGIGVWVGLPFLCALLCYIVLTLSYTLVLKHIVIVDVMAVAMGFVIRAMAGAIALDVQFSNWLVVCTLFLALFLALSKRRHELTLLEEGAGNHRAVHEHYSTPYLDQLILMMAGGALITYTIYTCSPEVVDRFGTDKLYTTIPFVVYGLFRYLFLLHRRAEGGDPSSTLLKDVPLGITVLLWGAACAGIIYL